MIGGDYECNNCKRPGCLKKPQYVKLTNVPTCPVKDRIVLLNKSNVWLYYDIIRLHVSGQRTLISYISAFLNVCPKSILDERVYDILNRYFYCKEYNVQPFSGDYDEQPTEWLFFSNVIQDEIEQVKKSQQTKLK